MSSNELHAAIIFIIRAAREELFSADIAALKEQRTTTSKGSLLSLSPFLDDNDLLRVGGRIGNCHLTNDIH